MKKTVLIVSLFFAALYTIGQTAFIHGTISTTGGGVAAGEMVYLTTDTIGGLFYSDTLTTDSNGYYGANLTFPIPPGGTSARVYVKVWEYCSSQMLEEVRWVYFPNSQTFPINITICLTQSQCQAHYYRTEDPLNPNTFYFTDLSWAAPTSTYLWDFGDGNTSTQQNPTHTYVYSGVWIPSLTVTNNQGCNSTTSFYDTIYLSTGIHIIDAELTDILQPQTATIPGSTNQVEVRIKNVGIDTITQLYVIYRLHYNNTWYPLIDSDTIQLVLAPGDSLDHQFATLFSPPSSASYELWANVWADGDYNYLNSSFYKTFNNNPLYCNAYFGAEQDTFFLNKYSFSDSSSSNISSWYWTFGDGGMSYLQNPTHTYTTAGNYTVTLNAQDTSGCMDTYSTIVNNPVTYNCYSYYSYAPSTTNPFTITFTSQNSPPGVSQTWDFGDGNSDTGSVVTHTYAIPGSYPVCLFESGSGFNCMPHCQNHIVGSFPGNGSLIGNVVLQSNLMPMDATVYLIEYDSASQILTAIDTTTIAFFGLYSFTNIPYGDYMVKAALNPASPYYANYLPTYHQSFLHWSQITPIYVNAPFNGLYQNIYMIQGSNPGGPGFIGGNVNNGANKMLEGKGPAENVEVILLDDQNNPQGFTMTDFKGDFEFDNLAFGSYKLLVELMNVPTDTAFVVLDPTNTSSTGTQFTIDSNSALVTTGINDLGSDIESIKLLGNPANESVQIELISLINGTISLSLRNVIGQEVSRTEVDFNGGINIIQIPTGDLEEGLYFVKANFNGKSKSLKIVIEH